MQAPWNGLEIVKLAVSLVTPVLVLILGIVINNSIKAGERATALRSKIYEQVGGDLNDIYSYLAFVGSWKEMTPPDVIAKKRAVDKAMYTYRPFFSDELFRTYETFMNEAFKAYGGAGKDARIRSDISTADGDRKSHGKEWKPEWEDRFTTERNKEEQRNAYNKFLEQLARDLELN
ncbi:hypothetical protein D0B54_00935 [Solimonas sp. K1W22B-7]|uniref:hypothetical protein n=1 Tax=Solimonas sp. K1W22B-7 TaxID=2303331 RepID=UPI000E334368|nr:hypothetical protein [Solimonas sp. K1W22B-7]AXQ27339.1 hypothetical protein D0B54_00935 [Solimonas sp. K1W22B-7]